MNVKDERSAHFWPPNVLYKFLRDELISVLEGRKLKCTMYQEFDDVLDSFHVIEDRDRDEINTVGAPYYFREAIDYSNCSDEDLEAAVSKFRTWAERSASKYPGSSVDAIVDLPPFFKNSGKAFLDSFRSEMIKAYNDSLILCLSENCDNRIMWERYANASRGFCLGFDSRATFLKPHNSLGPRRVIYSDEPSRGPLEVGMWRRWIVKHPSYAYEQEWRIRYPFNQTAPLLHKDGRTIQTVEFQIDDIREVVLGARASDELFGKVVSLVGSATGVYKIVPKFEGFERVRLK